MTLKNKTRLNESAFFSPQKIAGNNMAI